MLFAEDLARVGWRFLHFAPDADLTDDLRRDRGAERHPSSNSMLERHRRC
jgi:hypothetical protein